MDFVTDQNPKHFYKASTIKPLPDYVKAADVIMPESLTDLAESAFASPVRREYPVFNKAAAYLSAAYALGAGAWFEDDRLAERIKTAAALHGNLEDVEELEQAYCEHLKAAAVEDRQEFALNVEFDDGVRGFYPIATDVEITKSAAAMARDFYDKKFGPEIFADAARALAKSARDLGYDLDDLPGKVREYGLPNLVDFDHALEVAESRKLAGVDEEGVSLYKEAVEAARQESLEIGEAAAVEKYAYIWAALDETNGVKYDRQFLDPIKAFHAGIPQDEFEKLATSAVVVGGVLVPSEVVASFPTALVDREFRKESAEKVKAAITKAGSDAAQATAVFNALSPATTKHFLQLLVA